MWMLKGVGNVAYSAVAATGLVKDESVQPDNDAAWPPKPLLDADFDARAEIHLKQSQDLLDAKDWHLSNYVDPEGGDLRLWTRPMVGRYHSVKVTMSLRDTTPEKVLAVSQNPSLAFRKKFSPDMVALENRPATAKGNFLQHVRYSAPPPITSRDFVFLVGKKTEPDGTVFAWGCSVAYESLPETTLPVRGVTIWVHRLTPVGDHVMLTYANMADPRGWAPPWIVSYLTSVIGKEFVAMRSLVAGKDVNAVQLTLSEVGVSEEEAMKEAAQQRQQSPVPATS